MKSGKIAAALILILVSSQGCLFDPRDSEPPETGEVDTWIVPNTPKDVFLNLASGWVSAKNSNYERSLDPEFRFYPRPEDEALFGNPQLFADWTKEVEIAWLTRVKRGVPGRENDTSSAMPTESLPMRSWKSAGRRMRANIS